MNFDELELYVRFFLSDTFDVSIITLCVVSVVGVENAEDAMIMTL